RAGVRKPPVKEPREVGTPISGRYGIFVGTDGAALILETGAGGNGWDEPVRQRRERGGILSAFHIPLTATVSRLNASGAVAAGYARAVSFNGTRRKVSAVQQLSRAISRPKRSWSGAHVAAQQSWESRLRSHLVVSSFRRRLDRPNETAR